MTVSDFSLLMKFLGKILNLSGSVSYIKGSLSFNPFSILCTDTGHRPASLLKMTLFHRCFSNVLLVKTWFLHK